MTQLKSKETRLAEIKSRVSKMIDKNREGVGTNQTIGEIEVNLLEELLNIGKLLIEDRLIEEETSLEDKGYEIKKKERIKG